MKKLILLAATAATLTFSACNSCGNKRPALVIESETDSLYLVNDSTVADKQTFVFEGLMPLDNGRTGNVLLTIQTVSLNDDGTYTITTEYTDSNNTPATTRDSGETIVLIGIPNDSTAIVYELISDNSNPKINMQVNSDSTLTRLDSSFKPISNNPAHRLVHKKQK